MSASDAPEDFKRMVEAMHWAKALLEAVEMEGELTLSLATHWVARAMDAARRDEREDLARAWSDNDQ